MIPSDVRLFTWVDVEEVIARAVTEELPNKWLVKATAYWDQLTIHVRTGERNSAQEWLLKLFDPRIRDTHNGEPLGIVLEAANGDLRLLPVAIEESDEVTPARPMPPTFSRPLAIEARRVPARPERALGPIPIAVFHSFKGGVGRTTHAISLALAASSRTTVLLVDADIEAPGISWHSQTRISDPPIGFADLIALAHGDSSPDFRETVTLAADKLRNSAIQGCFVLPAFRNLKRLPNLDIRPEHLIKGQSNPFIFTEIIAAIGRELGVGLIVIDLRAGYSELAAGLLLDPRTYRVFVTTLSGQAIEGSVELLRVVSARAPSVAEYEPYPTIIVNQIPEGLHREHWRPTLDRLVEARAGFLPAGEDYQEDMIFESGFDQNLQMPSTDWDKMAEFVRRSGALAGPTKALLEWLSIKGAALNTSSVFGSVQGRREKLRDFASGILVAERRVAETFLDTGPIRSLAENNFSQMPIAVIVGPMGAGKTFTFLQQLRLGFWKRFVQETTGRTPSVDAVLSATLSPVNLSDDASKIVTDSAAQASRTLGFETPLPPSEIRDYIRNQLLLDHGERQWLEVWLNCVAWSVGFQSGLNGAGRQLTESLDAKGEHVVALLDGLEDLFQSADSDVNQQRALKVLVQDVPLWLSQQPKRSLGLLVYIRRDLISFAFWVGSGGSLLSQLYSPFADHLLERYSPYRLKWDRTEALRLADWVCSKARDISPRKRPFTLRSSDAILTLTREDLGEEEELRERLWQLWGRKLGKDESREARSADWVLNVLSDSSGQIQARDLVTFISLAAELSVPDARWSDRFLTPTAIRGAVSECSARKIAAIKKENPILKRALEKLESLPQAQRLVPFDSSLGGLTREDLKILEDNGALINDGGSYYLPELYLHGLGFNYSKPGRRRAFSYPRP